MTPPEPVDRMDVSERKVWSWRELCEMVDAHYSGSLDHRPAYVKRIREALDAEPSPTRGAVDPDELERVAAAIYEARVHTAIINGWRSEPEALRERFRKAARAALAARGAVCVCGNGEAEDDRSAVLRCPVHGPGAVR